MRSKKQALHLSIEVPFPTVSHPVRMLWSSPKSSNLLRPRAKCSMIRYISSGLAVEPAQEVALKLQVLIDESNQRRYIYPQIQCLLHLSKSIISTRWKLRRTHRLNKLSKSRLSGAHNLRDTAHRTLNWQEYGNTECSTWCNTCTCSEMNLEGS